MLLQVDHQLHQSIRFLFIYIAVLWLTKGSEGDKLRNLKSFPQLSISTINV